jgi:hypothetical protein
MSAGLRGGVLLTFRIIASFDIIAASIYGNKYMQQSVLICICLAALQSSGCSAVDSLFGRISSREPFRPQGAAGPNSSQDETVSNTGWGPTIEAPKDSVVTVRPQKSPIASLSVKVSSPVVKRISGWRRKIKCEVTGNATGNL